MQGLRLRVMKNDVHRWGEIFLRALDEAAAGVDRLRLENPRPDGELPVIQSARRLILLLDYDGTLVPTVLSPELALPDDALLDLLRRLSTRRRTELHLLSGRTTGFLERWFSSLPIHLHAEHGSFSRAPGKTQWRRRDHPDPSWQESVRPILADFARRTPGALVEVKEAGLAWHWRAAEPDVGDRQANELGIYLGQLMSNQPVELLWGDHVLGDPPPWRAQRDGGAGAGDRPPPRRGHRRGGQRPDRRGPVRRAYRNRPSPSRSATAPAGPATGSATSGSFASS